MLALNQARIVLDLIQQAEPLFSGIGGGEDMHSYTVHDCVRLSRELRLGNVGEVNFSEGM